MYIPTNVSLTSSAYKGWLSQLKTVETGPHGTLYEVRGARRGPRLVDRANVARGPEDALTQIAAAPDLSSTVILEAEDGGPAVPPPGQGQTGSVTDVRRGTNEASVAFTADRTGWLVVPIGYSEGWHAEIDGDPIPIRPANFAYSAVRVPAGEHRVTFQYRPPLFDVGLGLTCAWVVAAIGLLARTLLRRRNAQPERKTHVQHD